MRRRRGRNSTEEDSSIDLTPMLDVVFILLIFFIVSTSFVKESGIQVSRPSAKSATKKERANLMVAISEGGEVWIQKRKVDVASVRANIERLHAESPEGQVVVQADKDSRNGLLVEVMDQIRMAGVENISIAAKIE